MPDPIRITISGAEQLQAIATQYTLTALQVKQIGTVGINRTLGTVATGTSRRITQELNLRARSAGDAVSIDEASFDKLSGSVSVNRKRIPLIDFIGTREVKGTGPITPTSVEIEPGVWRIINLAEGGGVSVQVRRGGVREVLEHTFIATMKSGHEGVFERRFKAGRHNYVGERFSRLPIEERFGLTPTAYLANAPAVVKDLTDAATETLAKNIDSQLQRRLAESKPSN